MLTSSIQVRRCAGALGAQISGVDLRDPSDALIAEIGRLLAEHQVLFFRDQPLSPAEQAALGRRFGTLQVHPAYPHPAGSDAVAILEHTAEKPSLIGEWHTDMTYGPTPPLGSILQAHIVPEVGGDTLFASMTAAYEGLSAGMRRYLDPLRAVHSFAHGFRHSLAGPEGHKLHQAVADNPPTVHPVIRVHPVSGRKCVFVNPLFTTHIVGVPEPESRAILDFLYAHAVEPAYTVRFAWTPRAIAFWDNRSTQHRPVNDHGPQHRMLHRVTIDGDRPLGPADERGP